MLRQFKRTLLFVLLHLALVLAAALPCISQTVNEDDDVIAIVGVTVIDGNGGAPASGSTIVVSGRRIKEIGPESSITVPRDARLIDGEGKYVIPGIVDTNVHMSPLRGEPTFARYWERLDEIVLQGVQLQLKHGTTTVRDSYGTLEPLKKVRDAIEQGEVIGPRMFVAGNIVGWGGPYSDTFSRIQESGLSFFEERINALFTQGTGEHLMHMTADELRLAINEYLDKGPDFIKYGGTWHINYPTLIGFSPRAQKVIVEETQKRGLVAETHSTTLEGLLISIEAGVDVIQHPEVVGHREITDEIVELIVERDVICSMLPNKYTGTIWQEYLEKQSRAVNSKQRRLINQTTAEIWRVQEETGVNNTETILIPNLEMRRRNAIKLIKAGCTISVGPDNVIGIAPEFRRSRKSEHLDPGIGTIIAIEGLVELGMSPSEAIVAATKNGAIACKGIHDFGTLETGKFADMLILSADPLSDISNLRNLDMVMKEGQLVDLGVLPTVRPYGEWGISR